MVAQDAVFPALRLIRYICVMVSDNGDLHVSGQFAPALHTIVCGAKGQCTFLDSVVDTDDPFMVAMLLQCMKLLGCSEDHFGVRRCKKYLTSAKVNDSWPNCSTQTCAFVDFVYHSSTPGARGVRIWSSVRAIKDAVCQQHSEKSCFIVCPPCYNDSHSSVGE